MKSILKSHIFQEIDTNQENALLRTMNSLRIRKLTLADLDQLLIIGKETFTQTFAAHNTQVNMKAYLETAFTKNRLGSELQDEDSEFYFAELEGQIVGYLKLNFKDAQTEIKDGNALEIERIYVLQAFQGKKIGQTLYNKAIGIARNRNLSYVWLGVWEKNPKAIRFYTKNGFEVFDQHIFKLGDDLQTDLMMKLMLD